MKILGIIKSIYFQSFAIFFILIFIINCFLEELILNSINFINLGIIIIAVIIAIYGLYSDFKRAKKNLHNFLFYHFFNILLIFIGISFSIFFLKMVSQYKSGSEYFFGEYIFGIILVLYYGWKIVVSSYFLGVIISISYKFRLQIIEGNDHDMKYNKVLTKIFSNIFIFIFVMLILLVGGFWIIIKISELVKYIIPMDV